MIDYRSINQLLVINSADVWTKVTTISYATSLIFQITYSITTDIQKQGTRRLLCICETTGCRHVHPEERLWCCVAWFKFDDVSVGPVVPTSRSKVSRSLLSVRTYMIYLLTAFGLSLGGNALPVGRSRVRFPMVSLEFFIGIILPAAIWRWGWLSLEQKWVPGMFFGGKGGRCVGLTTLPPSCADCLEIWEPQPSGTLRACQGL
jgi:hypothetical protein